MDSAVGSASRPHARIGPHAAPGLTRIVGDVRQGAGSGSDGFNLGRSAPQQDMKHWDRRSIRKMREVVVSVVLVLSVAGCGGQSDTPSSEAGEAKPSPVTEQVSLRDACPQIEAAFPSTDQPESPAWQEFSDLLAELSETGEVETKNAIATLEPPVDEFASEEPLEGLPFLEARSAMRGAVSTLRDRCEAVGSSAFQ